MILIVILFYINRINKNNHEKPSENFNIKHYKILLNMTILYILTGYGLTKDKVSCILLTELNKCVYEGVAMKDLITIGEMVIDFLPGREPGSYIRNAGGAPANVAIAASRNGLSAGMYCKVGNDDFGRFLLQVLRDNRVQPMSEKMSDDAVTTMAFVSLNEDNDRSFTFARKPGADMFLTREEIDEDEIKNCIILHAGSCSLSAEPEADATQFAMTTAHAAGKMVSFDINYRALMWNSSKKRCEDKLRSVLGFVDLLKMSDEEADIIGGYEKIPEIMLQYDISVVVFTMGSRGTEVFFNGSSFVVPGYRVEHIADTTGAGDAFWGGFLSFLLFHQITKTTQLDELILRDAAKFGNAAGALSVTAKGAITSLPTREMTEKYQREYEKEKV